MSYTLFYAPGKLSMLIHWILIDLAPSSNVKYDLQLLDFEKREQKDSSYLQLNPKGRVPTLIIDGQAYTESVALLLILAERHPELNLAPAPSDPLRAKFLETLIFFANGMLPSLRDWFYASVDGSEDPVIAEGIRAMAKRRLHEGFELLNAQLDGKEYLLGDHLTVADYLLTGLARWTRKMDRPSTSWVNIKRLIQTTTRKESWKQVNEKEGLVGDDYWPWNFPEAME